MYPMRPRMLRQGDWDLLIGRLKAGECTPFLGAGACAGVLPLAKDIAQEWAKAYDYPLPDTDNLIQVAQFLAVQEDARFPKEKLKQRIGNVKPDFTRPAETHCVLADLPLPIYITTNYDDFMVQALAGKKKNPEQELCRWNRRGRDQKTLLEEEQRSIFKREVEYIPSAERPVVFHLHGNFAEPDSMVLTEDDYLDFLINIAEDPQILPHQIQKAFTETSLLFLGYRLADANFRVVFRSLVGYLQRSCARVHVSVQLAPDGLSEEQRQKALEYLDSYFRELKVKVYWGTCEAFAEELSRRMGKL